MDWKIEAMGQKINALTQKMDKTIALLFSALSSTKVVSFFPSPQLVQDSASSTSLQLVQESPFETTLVSANALVLAPSSQPNLPSAWNGTNSQIKAAAFLSTSRSPRWSRSLPSRAPQPRPSSPLARRRAQWSPMRALAPQPRPLAVPTLAVPRA